MIVLPVDPSAIEDQVLVRAVAWLRRGGVVLFPTDTFYGLAVDPMSEPAVRTLFDLKGRDASAAMPLIAASAADIEAFGGPLTPATKRLGAAFWPGPLAVVIDAPPSVARAVHAGRRTVAVRVPGHPVARALAAAWGGVLTATSANRSGQPPAVRVADVSSLDLDVHGLAIDAGETPGGAPSTIVDARGARPILVRDGAIAWNRVLESLKE